MSNVVVCIPCFNAETTIARTLDTIVNQNFPLMKIKVFDNISTDRTVEIIKNYASKYPNIELHINEKNLGAEGNFTRCIQAAEGDYCAILHSDDLYEPGFISHSIKAIESSSGAVASFCNAYEINQSETVIGERFFPQEMSTNEVKALNEKELMALVFKYGNFITCPSVVVRSDIYKNQIKHWNGEKYKTSADLDVWMRLVQFGRIVGIKEKLMRYRVAEASYSYRIAKKRITRHDLFLVLDELVKNKKISKEDEENLYFLNMKDQSLRSLNIIRTKNKDVCFPNEYRASFLLVFKKLLSSKWHFKMGTAILLISLYSKALSLIGWNKTCKK